MARRTESLLFVLVLLIATAAAAAAEGRLPIPDMGTGFSLQTERDFSTAEFPYFGAALVKTVVDAPGGTSFQNTSLPESVEEELRLQNQRLQRAEKISSIGHWDLHLDDGTVVLSPGAQAVLGVDRTTMTLAETYDFFPPSYAQQRKEALRELIEQGTPYDMEFQLVRGDGEYASIHSVAAYDPNRHAVFGTLMDITEFNNALASVRRQQRILFGASALVALMGAAVIALMGRLLKHRRESTEQLQRSYDTIEERERQLSSFLSNMPGVAYRCHHDPQWTMTFLSDGLTEIVGYEPEQLLRNQDIAFGDLIHPDHRVEVYHQFEQAIERKTPFSGEYPVISSEGDLRWILDQAAPVYDGCGRLLFWEGMLLDITQRKRAEERLQYLTYHDPVTGTYNRNFAEEALRNFNSTASLPLGIVMVDVNGLKMINDSLGHASGDRVLARAADLLQDCAPPYDAVISRWGGDEFLVLLPHTDHDALQQLSTRIQELCSNRPHDYLPLRLSVGYALRSTLEQDATETLTSAEDHMHRHKVNAVSSSRSMLVASLQNTLAEKSHETQEHAQRLQELAQGLGKRLGLSSEELNQASVLALLHDIGKVGVPETILTKPGPLDSDQREVINRHPEIGQRITAGTPDLAFVADGIRAHHERWDGTGYPDGTAGRAIPLAARIIAVVDAFEAMTSDRPYRRALSVEEALVEIEGHAGSQFDPDIASTFLAWMRKEAFTEDRCEKG